MQRADSMAVKVSVILSFIIFISSGILITNNAFGEALQILSKSKLEKCERSSANANIHGELNCTRKILVNIAIPSNSSGGEASMVAEVVEVEENSTNKMQTLRVPPVITINKSAAYALFELTYIRDVPYKPQEFYVQTRKCEPDADARIVQISNLLSLWGSETSTFVMWKLLFHVFGIGQRTLGFSVRIAVKTASKVSEVIVGPENRTAISNDNFLRVNMVGDFAGYTNIPSFEDFYLVIPRQHGPGQPPDLGRNFSLWMLLERVRFTLDGLECNKIGVGYEAFNGQPDFCAAPFWSCLHNQLWNFFESHLILKLISVWLVRKQPLFVFNAGADQNRIGRNQPPLYGVVGRFERINDHPDAGPRSFSIGITEVLNTNLLIELGADDIEYVYQRSPGKILGITVPTFEALVQFGIAKIETKNVGEVEASYSLTCQSADNSEISLSSFMQFQCSKGVMMMEEQFFIMKPEEVVTRSFKIDPTTDQAAKYACSAILKDSEFKEVDRAECQFTTIATVLDNGTQKQVFGAIRLPLPHAICLHKLGSHAWPIPVHLSYW
ncbi:hypothetical protein KSS87_001341 [Heliosperma pusillum]|nr:hypothetical protein KSS87_001341 [Heliosperma pusillum]